MTKEKQDNGKRENELIDEMIARHGHSAAAILGQSGLVAQLTKRVSRQAGRRQLVCNYNDSNSRSGVQMTLLHSDTCAGLNPQRTHLG